MKTVIEMAREAGMVYREFEDEFANANTDGVDVETLERFAELVRVDEREACAKVCGELLERPSGYQGTWEGYGKFKTQMTGQECAAAIRARSNT